MDPIGQHEPYSKRLTPPPLQVGENLQDHVGLGGFTFMINKEVSMVQNRIENVPAVLRYAMFGDGPLTVLGGKSAPEAIERTPAA